MRRVGLSALAAVHAGLVYVNWSTGPEPVYMYLVYVVCATHAGVVGALVWNWKMFRVSVGEGSNVSDGLDLGSSAGCQRKHSSPGLSTGYELTKESVEMLPVDAMYVRWRELRINAESSGGRWRAW